MRTLAALLGTFVVAIVIAAVAPARAGAADPRIAGVTADVSVVYAFKYPDADARTPTAPGPILASDGRIYGVGETGGECSNGGGIYSIGLGETQDTLVHGFPCDANHQFIAGEGLGYGPYRGGIADGGDGFLYGTTLYSYDPTALGDIYRIHPDGSGFQIVHRWSTTSDAPGDHNASNPGDVTPSGRILLASDGYLYGVTVTGGQCGQGSIYRLDRSTLAFKTVYSFCHQTGDTVGANPLAGLLQGPDGALYGTTEHGGVATDGFGTVFRLAVDAAGNGSLTTIHMFGGFDGQDPQAKLYLAPDGHMYGTTAIGNENNNGEVFRIDPDGTFAVVHEFGQGWGHVLYNGVVTGPGGFLYGITWGGGQYNWGTVYVLDPYAAPDDTSAVNFLYSFDGSAHGGDPYGDLLPVGGDTYYDTTQNFGPYSACSSCGVLWKVHFTAPPPADHTPPTISCGGPDAAWHAADVTIACTASDGGSGLNDPGDSSFTLKTHVPAGTADPNAPTDSRQVCDKAGNCATAGPLPGNMVDRQPPTIAIASPAGSYPLGSAVAAHYSCTDNSGSGLKSCSGPAVDGGPVDTGSTGTHTFTVSAEDNVGNTATKSVDYTVFDPAPVVHVTKPTAAKYPLGSISVVASFDDPPAGDTHSCTISWGDGTTSAGTVDEAARTCSGSHAYTTSGAKTIGVSISDNGGSGSDTVTITLDAPPRAAFSYTPAQPVTGGSVAFDGSASSDADGPIASYTWNFGDGASGAGVKPSHAYAHSGTYGVTLTVTDGGGYTNAVTKTVTVSAADTTKPTCVLTATGADSAGRKYIEITVGDSGSGLATILVTASSNATTPVPPFVVGTTAPVVVRATKIDQSLGAQIALRLTDVAGNVVDCDPVLTSIMRDPGGDQPATQTFTGLGQSESKVTVTNGDPGLRKIRLDVNGVKFVERALAPGEKRSFDIAAAMNPGSNNTVVLSGKGGRKGASADILISDS